MGLPGMAAYVWITWSGLWHRFDEKLPGELVAVNRCIQLHCQQRNQFTVVLRF